MSASQYPPLSVSGSSDGTTWIRVSPSNGDYATLTAALQAHPEAGARFIVSGAVTEPSGDGVSSSSMSSFHSYQHIYFTADAEWTLSAGRLFYSASDTVGLSLRTEGPLRLKVANGYESSEHIGAFNFQLAGSSFDFSQATFLVSNLGNSWGTSTATILHAVVNTEGLQGSDLGHWTFSLGGSPIGVPYVLCFLGRSLSYCRLDAQVDLLESTELTGGLAALGGILLDQATNNVIHLTTKTLSGATSLFALGTITELQPSFATGTCTGNLVSVHRLSTHAIPTSFTNNQLTDLVYG